uniref:Pecanex-like protein n=1 Tax=Caenorhabditis tropicalis TaxID=1561998 RepID=A0A1I7UYX3_9PELO
MAESLPFPYFWRQVILDYMARRIILFCVSLTSLTLVSRTVFFFFVFFVFCFPATLQETDTNPFFYTKLLV